MNNLRKEKRSNRKRRKKGKKRFHNNFVRCNWNRTNQTNLMRRNPKSQVNRNKNDLIPPSKS